MPSGISPGRREVRVPSTVGDHPLKQISMIDKEYIKEIISCITKKKADGNIVPATASMSEIMTAVREDALECMRTMCNEREIAVNRTLNSVSFKCL